MGCFFSKKYVQSKTCSYVFIKTIGDELSYKIYHQGTNLINLEYIVKNNKLDGECCQYDKNGKLIEKKIYHNGQLKFHVSFDCFLPLEDDINNLKKVKKYIVFDSKII